MSVHDPDLRRLRCKQRHEPLIRVKARRTQAGAYEHPSAQGADLLVILPRNRFVREKIKLYEAPVNMPVVVHQHGLDAGPGHIADGLQDADHDFPPPLRRSRIA